MQIFSSDTISSRNLDMFYFGNTSGWWSDRNTVQRIPTLNFVQPRSCELNMYLQAARGWNHSYVAWKPHWRTWCYPHLCCKVIPWHHASDWNLLLFVSKYTSSLSQFPRSANVLDAHSWNWNQLLMFPEYIMGKNLEYSGKAELQSLNVLNATFFAIIACTYYSTINTGNKIRLRMSAQLLEKDISSHEMRFPCSKPGKP